MKPATLIDNIVLTIGRAQSASSNDETMFIANHLHGLVMDEVDKVRNEKDALIDELKAELLQLKGEQSEEPTDG